MTESTDEVKIDEFSTGIRFDRTADGGWVSLGFTGQYMNVTIDKIPTAVKRSIANKEFAVAEGASRDEPAVIGRVVLGAHGERHWSVVAIVTRGRDEYGRSASLYRYFLYEGDNSLPKILAGIEDYRQHNGRMPLFNPIETNVVRSLNPNNDDAFDSEKDHHNFSDSAPVIIKPGEYNEQKLHQLHQLATEKADGQPVAWAFNVEALEQPGRFHIIQAASDKAYDLLQKAKVNTPQLPVLMVDEQAIKSAIKGLINSSTAKREYVEAIANSLGNSLILDSYWRDIFDGQGADKALIQGLYTDQFVRLLVLKAIVIPETLPDYLVWLEKGNKQNDTYKVAAEFDCQLSQAFSEIPEIAGNIEVKVSEGFQILLPSLLEQKVSPKAVKRLFDSRHRLWRKFSHQFISDLNNDLNLIKEAYSQRRKQVNLNFKLKDASWQKIMRELQNYFRRDYDYSHLEKYQPFAELFYNLGNPEISAFFYHVCFGKVPKRIFYEIPHINDDRECNIYGVHVKRELTSLERVRFAVTDTFSLIESLPIEFFIILIAVMLLGLTVGKSHSFLSTTLSNLFDKTKQK